jgi:transcriptional regulator of heat shock response
MRITKRQKEFLQSLIDLYQQKDTPIHYSEVAQKMRVSKWTAYDMLQLLHKEGFLEVEYLLPESDNYKWVKLGRSTITFYPTKKGYDLFPLTKQKISSNIAEFNRLKKEITQKFDEFKGKLNIRELLKEALQSKSPFIFCACVLLILILLVKKITEGIAEIKLISQIMPPTTTTTTYTELALIVFAGMCLGVLAKYINKVPTTFGNNNLDEYADYIQTYNQYISQMDKKEQRSLLNFLKDTLDEINKKNQK